MTFKPATTAPRRHPILAMRILKDDIQNMAHSRVPGVRIDQEESDDGGSAEVF
jgi:hypothetical protein